VVASLLRALDPATHAERIDPLLDAIVGARDFHEGRAASIRGLAAPDSLHVRITTTAVGEQLAAALATPAAWILPADSGAAPGSTPAIVGSGPFRFVRTDSTGVLLTAAPTRTSGVDTLRFRLVNGPEDAALQFELGRLDVVSPTASDDARLANSRFSAGGGAGPIRLSTAELALYYLGMNTRSPWLSDRTHRRAVAGAIDRHLATRVLVGDRGEVAQALLPHGMTETLGSGVETEWRAMARDAIDLPHMTSPAGSLQFWVPAGSSIGQRFAEFVQAALARRGVRVRIVTRPWAAFEKGLDAGQAELFFLSWYADTRSSLDFLTALFSSARHGAGGNRTWYSSPQADSLLALARATSDGRTRLDLLAKLQALVIADAPLLPLYEPINVTLVRPGVRGLQLDPLGCPRYDTVEVRRGR
jgi:ABC-type transport system substrate-binding protein